MTCSSLEMMGIGYVLGVLSVGLPMMWAMWRDMKRMMARQKGPPPP